MQRWMCRREEKEVVSPVPWPVLIPYLSQSRVLRGRMWEGGEGALLVPRVVVLWGEIWEALTPQGCLLQPWQQSRVWG